MQFSSEQNRALQSVSDWLGSSDQQVFRLFGYAGTGKTTLAKHFAEGVGGNVYFAAFTGKAAYVLQQKGCDATTIHSLIYIPRSKSLIRLSQLREKLKNTDKAHPKYEILRKMIRLEEENAAKPFFQLNLESDLTNASLLIIDEVSMVNKEMAADLMSFGCKILVLGDPAQLPPVFGGGYFIDAEPDFMLTDIHRQALDNPIIDLATRLRKHEMPAYGSYGDSTVIKRADMGSDLVMNCDQLLVGRNKTRTNFNSRIRELLGYGADQPVTGDRVVCLRNDHEVGLLNGALWSVEDALLTDDGDTIDLSIAPEQGGSSIAVEAHLCHFLGEKPGMWEKRSAQEFDYGYALTCHKAQGSEWSSVVVYNERLGPSSDQWKWLYTAVTRAAERVHLVT
tara:strand:+ start:159 stop:1340 length:1182 start_codon:yes stop_codon:yes gene_type:complete